MIELPELEGLRCFEAAARHESFRAAAQELNRSPSAFGARIAQLEERFGEPLFERTTRQVTLTAAGLRLLPLAQDLLRRAQHCVTLVRDHSAPAPPYTLTLGTRYELGMSWLVPQLQALREAHPARRISLRFGDSAELLHAAQRNELDAVITSTRTIPGAMRTIPLHEERYVLVASPALLCDLPLCSAADASAHRLLDLDRTLPLWRYMQDVRPAHEVWRFAEQEHLGTIAAIRYRALEGAGVAVLPRYFVEDALQTQQLISLFEESEPRRDMFRLIWREAHPLDESIEALASELAATPLR